MASVSAEKMNEALGGFPENYTSPVYVNVNAKAKGLFSFAKNYYGYAAITTSGKLVMVDFTATQKEHARYTLSPNDIKIVEDNVASSLGTFLEAPYTLDGKEVKLRITIPNKVTGTDIGDQSEAAKQFAAALKG